MTSNVATRNNAYEELAKVRGCYTVYKCCMPWYTSSMLDRTNFKYYGAHYTT
jgi:hypothetical protein